MPQLARLDKKPTYNGQEKYELSLDSTDLVDVHPIRSRPGMFGLHVQNAGCDNVISLWGLTPQQLRFLHDSIARVLCLPSAIDPDALRDLSRTLASVLEAHDKAEANKPGPFDDAQEAGGSQ